METLIISMVALFVIIIVGGLLIGPPRRRPKETILEPPPRGDVTVLEPADSWTDEQLEQLGGAFGEEGAATETLERPRFRDRLGKAHGLFSSYLGNIRGRGGIDEAAYEELEEVLLRADVGVATTMALLDSLRTQVKARTLTRADELLNALRDDVKAMLAKHDRTLRLEPDATNVWLFVGINGAGKTTSIGKVGLRYAQEGHSIVMAAGDTFRAAAAEQLTVWAERANVDIVRGQENADPGAVIFDAVQRASARRSELVLADTAGRLHTKTNLMEELKKVKRVAEREPAQLTEVLLVLDATTGQNGLNQAREFTEAVGCTGVILTKLDGSSKGGIVLAIENDLNVPIKLVGLGESAQDLVDFDPDEFVDALLDATD